jgi:cytokinin dehydrogenase
VSKRILRRTFLQTAAAAVGSVILGFDPHTRSWIAEGMARDPALARLPKLGGSLTLDESSLKEFSIDDGSNVVRMPVAVLKPASMQDVVDIVQYANEHQIKVGMRGQGHSQYGQSLVEQGIVIDSSTLNSVELRSAQSVDVAAGASWNDVNKLTLHQGVTPAAMGDTMTLSVGGFMCVGGWSNRSHYFGGAVDTVDELDVVTGTGQLVTCSPHQNSELFDMTLAGLGQCALIVRARIRLVPAPSHIVLQNLIYEDLSAFISDSKTLVLDKRFDHLGGGASKRPDGTWNFTRVVGKFYTAPDEPDIDALTKGLAFSAKSPSNKVSYADYLQRQAVNNAKSRDIRKKNPARLASLAMFIPASAMQDFCREMMAMPLALTGLHGLPGIPFSPINTRLFTRPLFKLPDEEIAFVVWLVSRAVPYDDVAAYAAVTEASARILNRMRAVGGKAYPPFAPSFSPSEWAEHYDLKTWSRLSEAKKKFDPINVLTPGPGIFR